MILILWWWLCRRLSRCSTEAAERWNNDPLLREQY